jgi:hypothetical protein
MRASFQTPNTVDEGNKQMKGKIWMQHETSYRVWPSYQVNYKYWIPCLQWEYAATARVMAPPPPSALPGLSSSNRMLHIFRL